MPLKTRQESADQGNMTHAVQPSFMTKRPAAWLVAGGIVTAFTLCASCLAILLQ